MTERDNSKWASSKWEKSRLTSHKPLPWKISAQLVEERVKTLPVVSQVFADHDWSPSGPPQLEAQPSAWAWNRRKSSRKCRPLEYFAQGTTAEPIEKNAVGSSFYEQKWKEDLLTSKSPSSGAKAISSLHNSATKAPKLLDPQMTSHPQWLSPRAANEEPLRSICPPISWLAGTR